MLPKILTSKIFSDTFPEDFETWKTEKRNETTTGKGIKKTNDRITSKFDQDEIKLNQWLDGN